MADAVLVALAALDQRINRLQNLREALHHGSYNAVVEAEAALPPQAVPPQVEAARRALRPGTTVDPAPERQHVPDAEERIRYDIGKVEEELRRERQHAPQAPPGGWTLTTRPADYNPPCGHRHGRYGCTDTTCFYGGIAWKPGIDIPFRNEVAGSQVTVVAAPAEIVAQADTLPLLRLRDLGGRLAIPDWRPITWAVCLCGGEILTTADADERVDDGEPMVCPDCGYVGVSIVRECGKVESWANLPGAELRRLSPIALAGFRRLTWWTRCTRPADAP